MTELIEREERNVTPARRFEFTDRLILGVGNVGAARVSSRSMRESASAGFKQAPEGAGRAPGRLEMRECPLVGVVDDKEIGQPSDIVEVVYGG